MQQPTEVRIAMLAPSALGWLHAVANDQGFYAERKIAMKDLIAGSSPALLQAVRTVSGELHGYLRPAAPDPSAGGHPVRQRLPQMSMTSVEG